MAQCTAKEICTVHESGQCTDPDGPCQYKPVEGKSHEYCMLAVLVDIAESLSEIAKNTKAPGYVNTGPK